MRKSKLPSLLAVILICVFLLACLSVGTNGSGSDPAGLFELSVREFDKFGNVWLGTTIEEINTKNIEPADIITVTIFGTDYDIPVGTSYTDVDAGCMVCRFRTKDDIVELAVNGGSFAEVTGMALKEDIQDDPGYRWNIKTDKLTVALKEKGGYIDEFSLRNLEMTDVRSDYSDLSDRDFVNYRALSSTGMKESTVFRGPSPFCTCICRGTYVMPFMQENGIRTVLDLEDTKEDLAAYPDYPGSYYAGCNVLNAGMSCDFLSEEFAACVRDGIRFMLENDGPYYVHCSIGKDRTGFFCAVLECCCGATYEDITDDYMKTYMNFYHLEKGSDTYETIARSNIEKILCHMFGVSDLKSADLRAEARDYLLSAGLSEEEFNSLTDKIGK